MKRTLALVAAAALTFAACGGDDDEPAADEPTDQENDAAANEDAAGGNDEEPNEAPADDGDDTDDGDDGGGDGSDDGGDSGASDDGGDSGDGDDGGDSGDGDDGDDGNSIRVNSLDDVPDNCKDLMRSFLRELEPLVEDIDFQTATMADLEAIADDLDGATADFDVRAADENCENLDFGSDAASFDAIVEFARNEAPGTVGYFEFIAGFIGDLDTSIATGEDGDGGDDDGGDGDGDTASPDAGGSCNEAIAVIEQAVAASDSMNDLPLSEISELSETLFTITTECSFNEMDAFFQRADIDAWLNG